MTLAYPEPELAAAHLRLRRWRSSDAPALVSCCNDAEIRRWLPPIPIPYTTGDAEAFINAASSDGGNPLRFAIETPGRPVTGAIGARVWAPGVVQVGYWVAPEARRTGIASGALALLAGWAARQEGVDRLQLFTDTENVPSMGVAERGGFRPEGVLRNWYDLRGERRDATMFALLPGDLS